MKIEPNKDIGMKAVNILVYQNTIELVSGEKVSPSALQEPNNAFVELCKSIDPNITYINVLIPDHADHELYFVLVEKGQQLGVYIQSVTRREKEIWDIWNVLKENTSD